MWGAWHRLTNIARTLGAPGLRGSSITLTLPGFDQGAENCDPTVRSVIEPITNLWSDRAQCNRTDYQHKTGKDYFTLPPSGYLYSYPGSLAKEVHYEFVSYTKEAAGILGARSTVHWEWMGTWIRAENEFLPKYARKDGPIRGISPVNAPYVVPIMTWRPKQIYKILEGHDGGRVVLFRPRYWRGVDNSGDLLTKDYFLSPDKKAEELGAYSRGSVAAIYMTSDGGLTLSTRQFNGHATLVSADTATRLALDARDWKQNGSPNCDEEGVDCGGPICISCSPESEICAGFDYDHDGLVDQDCLGSLVTVGDYDTGLVPDGDGGGGPDRTKCDDHGTAITSVGGFTGDFFDKIAADCSTFNVKVLASGSFETVITPNGGTRMIGVKGDKGFRVTCEPKEVLVGFDVWDHKPNLFAPNVVDSLRPICREVRWNGVGMAAQCTCT